MTKKGVIYERTVPLLVASMHTLFSSYPFLIPLFVGLLAEMIKILVEGIEKKSWHEGLFRPGGMPSTHSAFVTSLLILVAMREGLGSMSFSIAFCFASLTWYDAISSRKAIGEQAKVLNRLQTWEHFSERIGHSFLEVLGGIIFGTIVTLLGMWVGTVL